MSIHYDKLCQRVNIIPIFRVHNLHFDLITIQYLNGYSVGEFFFFFSSSSRLLLKSLFAPI